MTDLRGSQIVFYVFGEGEDTTYQLRGSQIAAYAWATFPAEELRSSQEVSYVYGMGEDTTYQMRSSQIAAYAWARGVVDNPKIRTWTASLDGHDWYFINLGILGTLAYDITTNQWADWSSLGLSYWRVHVGINWLGMGQLTAARGYGTNIVCGDSGIGQLWMFDATRGYDDGPVEGDPLEEYQRTVTGLVPMTMRNTQSVAGFYLTMSLGQPALTGAEITLRVSDDWGKSYWTAGTITVDTGEYDQEIAWRGLGLIRAPGRIYELNDNGAAVRINYAESR